MKIEKVKREKSRSRSRATTYTKVKSAKSTKSGRSSNLTTMVSNPSDINNYRLYITKVYISLVIYTISKSK